MATKKKQPETKRKYDEHNNEIINKAMPFLDGKFWKVRLSTKSVMSTKFTSYLRASIAARNYNDAITQGKTKLTNPIYKKQGINNANSKNSR